MLLDNSTKINGAGYTLVTALMGAINNSNLEMVKLLIDKGADVNMGSVADLYLKK